MGQLSSHTLSHSHFSGGWEMVWVDRLGQALSILTFNKNTDIPKFTCATSTDNNITFTECWFMCRICWARAWTCVQWTCSGRQRKRCGCFNSWLTSYMLTVLRTIFPLPSSTPPFTSLPFPPPSSTFLPSSLYLPPFSPPPFISFPPLSSPLSLSSSQYNDLLKKKQIVENDKSKIGELITELDQKKNEALQGAYERVNKVSKFTWLVSLLAPLMGSRMGEWELCSMGKYRENFLWMFMSLSFNVNSPLSSSLLHFFFLSLNSLLSSLVFPSLLPFFLSALSFPSPHFSLISFSFPSPSFLPPFPSSSPSPPLPPSLSPTGLWLHLLHATPRY